MHEKELGLEESLNSDALLFVFSECSIQSVPVQGAARRFPNGVDDWRKSSMNE